MRYIFYFLLSFGLSAAIIPYIKKLATKYKVYDYPQKRKVHHKPTLLLGGLGIYIAFSMCMVTYIFLNWPNLGPIPLKYYLAILAGGGVLTLGGVLDDKYNLPPKILWIFPALASLIAVWSGIGSSITQISNPFGPAILLDEKFIFLNFHFSIAGLFVFFWLLGMIFTTKFLDGLDGLCAGISVIGGLTVFSLSLLPHINQSVTASIAIIFAGSVAGFLVYNYHPATIFLGESGSTFVGFMLGTLSVILGGKIATALLVMGIPILDVAWAIVRRLWYRRSPFAADRLHLHHRLLDIGFSQRQTVGILWATSAFFGFSAVFLQSLGKLIALIVLLCVMVFMAIAAVIVYKRNHPHIPDLFDSIDSKKNH